MSTFLVNMNASTRLKKYKRNIQIENASHLKALNATRQKIELYDIHSMRQLMIYWIYMVENRHFS